MTPYESLLEAIKTHNIDEVEKSLSHNGEGLNMADADGNTPLHKAVEMTNQPIIKAFIDAGADINARNKRGETPLFKAIIKGKFSLFELLISNGADPTTTNIHGQSIEDAVIYCEIKNKSNVQNKMIGKIQSAIVAFNKAKTKVEPSVPKPKAIVTSAAPTALASVFSTPTSQKISDSITATTPILSSPAASTPAMPLTPERDHMRSASTETILEPQASAIPYPAESSIISSASRAKPRSSHPLINPRQVAALKKIEEHKEEHKDLAAERGSAVPRSAARIPGSAIISERPGGGESNMSGDSLGLGANDLLTEVRRGQRLQTLLEKYGGGDDNPTNVVPELPNKKPPNKKPQLNGRY